MYDTFRWYFNYFVLLPYPTGKHDNAPIAFEDSAAIIVLILKINFFSSIFHEHADLKFEKIAQNNNNNTFFGHIIYILPFTEIFTMYRLIRYKLWFHRYVWPEWIDETLRYCQPEEVLPGGTAKIIYVTDLWEFISAMCGDIGRQIVDGQWSIVFHTIGQKDENVTVRNGNTQFGFYTIFFLF